MGSTRSPLLISRREACARALSLGMLMCAGHALAQAPGTVGRRQFKPAALVGDGLSDNTSSLLAAIAEAEAAGGGHILIPAGVYFLKPVRAGRSVIELPAGIHISGAGRRDTTLVVDADAGHVFNAPFGNVSISDLTISRKSRKAGPWAPGHNIRLEGDNNRVERVASLDAPTYGIALGQRRYARRSILTDVIIADSGADGIDIKNPIGETTDLRIEGVQIIGCSRDPSNRGKAALDVRGKCALRDIRIEDLPPEAVGLRFRHGEAGSANGPGGHGSSAKGVRVRGGAAGGGQGVAIHAREIELDDVKVENVRLGFVIGAGPVHVARASIDRASVAALRTDTLPPQGAEVLFEDLLVTESRPGTGYVRANVRFSRSRFSACAGPWPETIAGVEMDSSCRSAG